MEANLDDLLQEALADFDDSGVPASAPVPAPVGSESQPPVSTTTPSASSSATGQDEPSAAPAAAKPTGPKGLGLGLGPGGADPLGRKGPRKAIGTSASTVAASSEQPSASGSSAEARKPAGAGLPKKPLNAEAQKLADDLLSLIQEAGLGGGPDDASALAGDLAGLLGGVSGAAGAGPSASSSAAASSARGGAPASGVADSSGDDDPLAKLFGRILGGMPPPGAAPSGEGAGADADAGPPPEFAALLQQMMGGLGALGGEGGPEGLGVGMGMGTGMGGMPAGAPPDLAALLGAAAAGADVRGAGQAGPSGRRPGAASMDEDDALASSRLAGLAQHTMKTVSKQAKATRGHVEGGSTGAAAGGGGGGVAGGAGMGGLAQILQELGGLGAAAGGSGGEGGEGGGPPGGVNMMVDFIMQHLLSKDVLYGPLKEIRDRYPPWLEAHAGKLPAEEYGRYVAQYEAVQRVCEHYEKAPGDYAKLMDLIQEMQTYGDPPGDIVEEMTGGAGRDLTTALANADADDGPAQPSLEELNGELNNCKMQ
ncbi:hypothetical protein HYH02_002311 [Chlamydomonas schloesseri]|uniref:Uncharacterized protein n=1 Tax=Chlamydomonas schloesseri TaxID=2026947 RepID=A0A835WT77_9CHLO|nr:hypothetical protein HYH02_002311 [Chlamydomonas schloesseri]|eukprot:KAG2452974.1 hypothetical protein HYH02_002311 [Chlamydomonas schloesseri]